MIYVEDFIPSEIDLRDHQLGEFEGNMVEVPDKHAQHTPASNSILYPGTNLSRQKSASYLELPVGAPILSVRSTIFTQDNQAVTFSKLCFNSEIIELNIVRMIG